MGVWGWGGRGGGGSGGGGAVDVGVGVRPPGGGAFHLSIEGAWVPPRGAGTRPGGRLTFFASPKKVSKERGPDGDGPLRCKGLPCGARQGREGRKLALRAQTVLTSFSAPACAPRRLLNGVKSNTSLARFALP